MVITPHHVYRITFVRSSVHHGTLPTLQVIKLTLRRFLPYIAAWRLPANAVENVSAVNRSGGKFCAHTGGDIILYQPVLNHRGEMTRKLEFRICDEGWQL